MWEAGEQGIWSRELAEAAEARVERLPPLRPFGVAPGIDESPAARKEPGSMDVNCKNPVVFILEYADGLRAAILLLPGHLRAFGYAARVNGLVESTGFIRTGDQDEPFSYQGLNIQEMFVTGQPQYPVERTLMTTGLTAAAVDSLHQEGKRLKTPHLAQVTYQPNPESTFWRT